MTSLEVEDVDADTLTPHPDNPRNGDVDAIVASIRVNGFYRPLIIAADGTILAGNHSYMAAMELGYTTLPAIRLSISGNSPEARRILLADNRTSDLARYDDGLLVALLDRMVEDEGLYGTGWTEADLATLLKGLDTPLNLDGLGNEPDTITCPACGHRWRG